MMEEPTNRATEELAIWEIAMQEQYAAERQLEIARRSRGSLSIYPLHAQVMALRNRAALLLAKAVETKLLAQSSDDE